MGQHKTNPNSIRKKQGLLPPKPVPMGAPERRRRLEEMVDMAIADTMSRVKVPDSFGKPTYLQGLQTEILSALKGEMNES